MRKRPLRGNTTPRVKVVTPPKTEKPIPENSAPSAQTKTDPNLDRKGWPVRVGSIIQIEDDIAVVKTVDNGALICRQLNDTNGGNNQAWNCRNVVVIPGLILTDDHRDSSTKVAADAPEIDDPNVDEDGRPIRVGAVIHERDNPDVVGIAEVVHDGGVIYRVISSPHGHLGRCYGFQCTDMVVELDAIPNNPATAVPVKVRQLRELLTDTMRIARRIADVRTECVNSIEENFSRDKLDDIIGALTVAASDINTLAMVRLEMYATGDTSARRDANEPWPDFE